MRFITGVKFRNRLLSVSVLLSMLSCGVYAQQKNSSEVISIERNKRDNAPKSILFSPATNYRLSDAQQIFSKYLELDPATDKMVLQSSTRSKMGVVVDRYNQYYKDIRIHRASYTVSSKDGRVSFVGGNFYKISNSLATAPALTESAAFNKALEKIGATKYMWQDPMQEKFIKRLYKNQDTSYLPKGQLVYVEDMSVAGGDGQLHLAYSFDIYAETPRGRDIVYVDAVTGKILLQNPMIKHINATGTSMYSATVNMVTDLQLGMYVLNDFTRGDGVFTYDMAGGTNYGFATDFFNPVIPWTTPDAGIDGHWGAEMVYDYWSTQQSRQSFDNLNGAIYSFIHFDVGYNNAFWDGSVMTYGDGTGSINSGFDPLTSLDICAHEIGHAVCQYTANLDYEAESGAMNEGFSDIWGAVIEAWANPNEADATPKQTWIMGEEITQAGWGLRSMSDPASHGDPDTYGGTNWVSTIGACGSWNDNCGVHTNSGVLNKWFYILSVGESGVNDNSNAYNVTGIGINNAATIAYMTELALVNNSQFADARTASINIATTLYGACSPQVQAVTNAWYAVGVGTAFVPCYPLLGFTTATNNITEYNSSTACPSSRVVNIPITVTNGTPLGGNAVATVSVVAGTAVAGSDYSIATNTLTFPAGSTTTQNLNITIFDNGAVNDNKYLKLQITLNTNGSNLVLNSGLDTMRINIQNQDNAPVAGSTNVLNVLSANTTSNTSSAFQSSFRKVRYQYLLTPAELTAAGVVPGTPISALAMNVTTKNSTAPYTGFTVSMGNTATANFTGGFITTGLTQVYSNNYSTVVGWNTLPFSANFTWDGTSNVVINMCYTNPANITNNDICGGFQGATLTAFARSNSTSASVQGCTLATTTGTSPARPIMRFTQVTPPTAVETVSGNGRIWNVTSGQEVYFYSTSDSEVVAGIKNITANLGCMNANVSASGNGFMPTVYGGTTRSRKEFVITPTQNIDANNNTTVYMTTAELNGMAPGSLLLVKTNEPTDATINMGNSVAMTPVLFNGGTYTGFSANFAGFGRYFLTDGPLPPPVPVITPAGSTTFCQGGNVLLNGNVGVGLTYSWLLNGAVIPGATASSHLATQAGNYQFIMANSVGISDTSAVVTITINPAPTATVTPAGPTTFCQGGNVLMNANTGTGYTYQWQLNNVNIGVTANNYTANTSGFYSVVVTANGCSATSAPVNVIVNALPTANANSNSPVCVGTITNLTATTVSGATYSWTGPNGFTSSMQNPTVGNTQFVNAGDYILTVTNSAGCVGKDTVTVVVNNGAPPAQPGPISGLTPLCSGLNETYSVPPVAGATSYTWTLPGGWGGTSTTNTINATSGNMSDNITVTANNACGSSAPQTFAVTVNQSPNSPGVIGSLVYCIGETPAQLTATGSNLMWYDVPVGGTGDPNAPTPTATTPGITSYYVSQSNGICESQRSIILVTVNALPAITVTQAGNVLTASGSYAYYQWYVDGILIVGANSTSYTTTQDGIYTVVVSDINGCTTTSDPIQVGTTGTANVIMQDPKFYPNPTTGLCWLELPAASGKTEVLITDMSGRIVERTIVKGQQKIQFDLSKAARGVYMIKVITEDKTFTSKVTLQ